jgi:hypothetical protein
MDFKVALKRLVKGLVPAIVLLGLLSWMTF